MQMQFSNKVKVWLTCPKTHLEVVRTAIGDAGIGKIGNYTHCSFVTEGKGYFMPNAKANPYIGETNKIEEVDEVVIEFICEQDQISLLKEIIKNNHPYEEVALDVFPLLAI
jgi:hypothetical protein